MSILQSFGRACGVTLISATWAWGGVLTEYTAEVHAEAHTVARTPGGQTDADDQWASDFAANAAASCEVTATARAVEPQFDGSEVIDIQWATVQNSISAASTDAGATFTSILAEDHDGYFGNWGGSVAAHSVLEGTLVPSLPVLQFTGSRVRTNFSPWPEECWDSVDWAFTVHDGDSRLLLSLSPSNLTGSITVTPGQPLQVRFQVDGVDSFLSFISNTADTTTIQMTASPEPTAAILSLCGFLLALRKKKIAIST